MRLATMLWMTLAAMLLGWYGLEILGAWVVLCYAFLYIKGLWEDRQYEKRRKERGW